MRRSAITRSWRSTYGWWLDHCAGLRWRYWKDWPSNSPAGPVPLLSVVSKQTAARHERTEGDLVVLHEVMEEVLYGCDVMPSALYITGATLSGV